MQQFSFREGIGREGEAWTASERENKEWAVIQDKIHCLLSRIVRRLCQSLLFILFYTAPGIPVPCFQAEFIVSRETMKYDRLNQ